MGILQQEIYTFFALCDGQSTELLVVLTVFSKWRRESISSTAAHVAMVPSIFMMGSTWVAAGVAICSAQHVAKNNQLQVIGEGTTVMAALTRMILTTK